MTAEKKRIKPLTPTFYVVCFIFMLIFFNIFALLLLLVQVLSMVPYAQKVLSVYLLKMSGRVLVEICLREPLLKMS